MAEKDLRSLLSAMEPWLDPDRYVFVTVAPGEATGLPALMRFREDEFDTLIVTERVAAREGLEGSFPCRRIVAKAQSPLDSVGFIARLAGDLAEQGIAVNPVSAFRHDHLFVPVEKAEAAMDVLAETKREAA